jgi:hypothetical protein
MILVKFGSGRFVLSGRSECAPEIYQRQFRLRGTSARQDALSCLISVNQRGLAVGDWLLVES